MIVLIDDLEYTVQIERKRIKNLILRLDAPRHIRISAPLSASKGDIEHFIQSRKDWIKKTEERLLQLNEIRRQNLLPDAVRWFGKIRPLTLVEAKHPALQVNERGILLKVTALDQDTVERIFYKEAQAALDKQCQLLRIRWDQMLDDYRLPHPQLRFRTMKSRWGSCIPAKAAVTLNTRLIHYPPECLDYVLLHEFVHMIVPNHGKRFYDLLLYYMPDFRDCEKRLREA